MGRIGQGRAELDRAGGVRMGCAGQGKAGQGRSGLAWARRAGRPRHDDACPEPQRSRRWPPAHGHPEARACPAPAHLTVYPRSSSLSSYRKDGMNTSIPGPFSAAAAPPSARLSRDAPSRDRGRAGAGLGPAPRVPSRCRDEAGEASSGKKRGLKHGQNRARQRWLLVQPDLQQYCGAHKKRRGKELTSKGMNLSSPTFIARLKPESQNR